jgi:YggT family protein
MVDLIIQVIRTLATILMFTVVAEVILSYFLPPFHSIRKWLGVILNPLLTPIRKYVPSLQGIDLSPLVLLILIQVAEFLLVSLVSIFR